MNPVVISAIGVGVAVVFTVIAMFKGMKPLLAGPICALIICLFCGVGYNQGLASEYSASFATSVKSNLLTFVSCCLLSRVMVNTRSAEVIANSISKLIPAKHMPISLFLICLVLRLGGMSVGAYSLTFAIGIYLCKEADYSEDILLACIVGVCYTVATFAPMFPSPTNALLQTALGTSSTAGMVSGMITTVVVTVAIIAYQEIILRRWKKQGRTFKAEHMLGKNDAEHEVKAPSVIVALIPVVLVFVCYNVFSFSASLAMFLGAFSCIIANWKMFDKKRWLKGKTKMELIATNFPASSLGGSMEYIKYGKSGLDVSRICLGTMGFGTLDRWGRPWLIGQDKADEVVKHALDLGINWYDTANMYSLGASEEILGESLKRLKPNRDELVIQTKVNQRMAKGPKIVSTALAAVLSYFFLGAGTYFCFRCFPI